VAAASPQPDAHPELVDAARRLALELPADARARRRARLIDRRRRAIVHEAGPAHPEFGQAFMRYYLPHYVREHGRWTDFADMHVELFAVVFGGLGSGEWHDHLAPRGYGKSTIVALALPLGALGLGGLQAQGALPYSLCGGRCVACQRGLPTECSAIRRYVWLIQDTTLQAKQSMESILAETEDNPRVRQDFPHLTPQLGRHNRPVADRDDDVVFASGQRLQALGSGQGLRGRRHRQYRPDLVLIDDLENDEHVNTKFQRDKLDRWLSSAVGFAVAKGADLHLVGTLLHNDAVLARVRKRDGWNHHRFEAFDEKGRPTWRYRDAKWHQDAIRRLGRRAYNREVLHRVTSEEDKMFPASTFQYGERPDPAELVDEATGEERGVRCRIAVDPAFDEKAQKKNDPSAIVVAMRRRGEDRFHVDHAWRGWVKGGRLKRRIRATYLYYQALGYEPIVAAEDVQAQVWLVQELAEFGIPVKGVRPGRKDKVTKAEPAALHYEQGRVYHSEHLRDGEFEAELDEFPDGEHDDFVDAVVYAILELQHDHAGGLAGVVEHGADDEEPPFVDPRGAEPDLDDDGWRDPRGE
jgi:predicted phage terminase large subunit-like protein